jgi:hypothetical protein
MRSQDRGWYNTLVGLSRRQRWTSKKGDMARVISILSLACMVLGLAAGCGGDEEPSEEVTAQEAAAAAPAFRMTARKLFAEYDTDEKTASAKYPGKVVLLSGVVAETGAI